MVQQSVSVRKITPDEKDMAETFQDFLRTFYSAFSDKDKLDYKKYSALKKSVKRFSNYPWYATAKNFFDTNDKRFLEYFKDRRTKNRVTYEETKQINDHVLQIFNSKNVDKIISMKAELTRYTDAYIKASRDISREVSNPLNKANPMIFGSKNFMFKFEQDEVDQILSKNLSEFKYTMMPQSQTNAEDYQYMAYWIMQLKDTDEDVVLNAGNLKKYAEYVYDTPEFKEYLKKVKSFLSDNKRSLLPEILEELQLYPSLKSANDKQKQKIDTVYRGIGFYAEDHDDTMDENDIMAEEKKRRILSTSKRKYVAQNFEHMIGHMESGRRSDVGYMITYELTSEAVLLDTNIFGGIFAEDEVIIDFNKIKGYDIKISYKRDDDYDWDDDDDWDDS